MPKIKKVRKPVKIYRFPRLKLMQGPHCLYLFSAPASKLWEFLSINEKIEDKDEGYISSP